MLDVRPHDTKTFFVEKGRTQTQLMIPEILRAARSPFWYLQRRLRLLP